MDIPKHWSDDFLDIPLNLSRRALSPEEIKQVRDGTYVSPPGTFVIIDEMSEFTEAMFDYFPVDNPPVL